MVSRGSMGFHNVLVLLMEPIFRPLNVQPITIIAKAGIQSFCKVLLTTEAASSTSTQVECTMHVCLPTPHFSDEEKPERWTENIDDVDVPLVMLGDPAYPLLQWLMKGFPDNGNLTRLEKRFNYRLSKARVVVEHTYGRLKGRWRCLLKRLDVATDSVPGLVGACCVLHNMCEMLGDGFDQDWLEGIATQESTQNYATTRTSTTSHSEANAVHIRKAFKTYFAD